MSVCENCKYYDVCGTENRTEECVGRVEKENTTMEMTKSEFIEGLNRSFIEADLGDISYQYDNGDEYVLHKGKKINVTADSKSAMLSDISKSVFGFDKTEKELKQANEFIEGMVEWFSDHELEEYQKEKMRDLIPEEFWERIGCEEKPKFKVYEVKVTRTQECTVQVAVPVDKDGCETENATDIAENMENDIDDDEWETSDDYEYEEGNCLTGDAIYVDKVNDYYSVINNEDLED